ncbi:MAG: ATP-binding protein [Thermodesulfobacteriota bacterium]
MLEAEPDETLSLDIGVVIRGEDCLSLLRDIQALRDSRLRTRLKAISVVTPSVACYKFAGEMGIRIFDRYEDMLSLGCIELVLELTGNPAIFVDLMERKPDSVTLLDQKAARLFFNLARRYDELILQQQKHAVTASFASTLLAASPDGVLVLNRDFVIIDCNASPLITGGKDRSAIIGKSYYDVIQSAIATYSEKDACSTILETIQTGKPSRRVCDLVFPGGGSRICQITVYPILGGSGEVVQFVVTVRDITQELSERIVEQTEAIKKDFTRALKEDRLTSLGRLVASVCHEINNPITSIVTFIKLVLNYFRENAFAEKRADLERYLELSFREALRCGNIVKNLLTFARQNIVEANEIDILEMVQTILMLTHHQLVLARIEFQLDLPDPPFLAWGDYGQIQQCLLNLVFNAIDAMPNGGILTIRGRKEPAGAHIYLEVSDTGQGIRPENLQHIFEPFFTTKSQGKGVGLGLAMVYGIIREHKGSIEVDSAPGKGTTFRLRLPQTAA